MEFDVPPSLLGDVDLTAFGAENLDIHVSAMLAPVISSCGGEGPKLHIGDLRIDASLNLFGTPMDVVMFASFTAGVEMSIEDGQLGLVLQDIEDLQSQIAIQQEDLIGSEALIASLLDDTLVPGLLDALGGGALGAFPLPEVPLTDDLLGLPAGSIPPGTALGINPTGISQTGGNSYIEGELK